MCALRDCERAVWSAMLRDRIDAKVKKAYSDTKAKAKDATH
jgi:hypothetical protein